jgi:lysophospholipase L1-like esterase
MLLAAPLAGAAESKPGGKRGAAKVEVGKVRLAAAVDGRSALLVPVRYPIAMKRHRAELRVSLLTPAGEVRRSWTLRTLLSGGGPRVPDRRRHFTFVHRVELSRAMSRGVGDGLRVRARALAALDVDSDGRLELRGRDTIVHPLPRVAGGGAVCSSIPHLRARPGRTVSVALPACESPRRWAGVRAVEHGRAWIRDGRLHYRAPKRFRGSEAVGLVAARRSAASSAAAPNLPLGPLLPPVASITVGSDKDVVVRALGDSVTAGFGYYHDGTEMTIGSLVECRPPAKQFNDACSSNSLNAVRAEGKVEYAPDFGLANNVSWAAQWANAHGITDFKNFAISGSEPKNWAPKGEFHSTTEQIYAEEPDYVVLTIGANPLLSEMLFGLGNMGCAVESDITGGYRQCVEESFAEVGLQSNLENLYTDLVENTSAQILLMQYHLSVPSTALAYSATQIAEMGSLLNREIAAVAAKVNPQRLEVIAPPHFNVGIDVSPVYPSTFSCSLLDFQVDGPSVQSDPTQVELEILHSLSFCEGPAGGGEPWVISGDTGIHPSAAGYTQMAARLPAPQ